LSGHDKIVVKGVYEQGAAVRLGQQSLEGIQLGRVQRRPDPIDERAQHQVGLAEAPPPRP